MVNLQGLHKLKSYCSAINLGRHSLWWPEREDIWPQVKKVHCTLTFLSHSSQVLFDWFIRKRCFSSLFSLFEIVSQKKTHPTCAPICFICSVRVLYSFFDYMCNLVDHYYHHYYTASCCPIDIQVRARRE